MFKSVPNFTARTKFLSMFVLAFILLICFDLSATDFKPGVSVGKILNSPAVQALFYRGSQFIAVIFAVVLVKNIFKFVSGGGDVNWFMIIAKFAIIFFLYNNAVHVVTMFTNRVVVSSSSSDTERLNKAFSTLDIALVKLAVGDPEKLDENKEDKGIKDAIKDTFNDISRIFSFQTIICIVFSIVAKGLLTISMITKVLMIDIFWPIFFQLTIIGFVFAVPLASLDGGMEALKKFAINVVEVALWPVFYNIAFSISIDGLIDAINRFDTIVNNPATTALKSGSSVVNPALAMASASAQVLSNLPLLAVLLAHLCFLIGLGFLIPLFSRMIVRNESVGIAASALTYSTGQQLMSMAKGAGALGGGALMSAGKGMLGMTSKGAEEIKNAGASATGGATPAGSGTSSGSGGSSQASGGGAVQPQSSPSSSGSGGNSPITGDLKGGESSSGSANSGTSSGSNSSGSGGGRSAHGGKPFYNQSGLNKGENQALQKLGGKNNPEAKKAFNTLAGMRKDGYNPKAINNQISNINSKFGTNLKKEDEK